MTYLLNDPADFADELLEGFVAANSAWVAAVPGGVVRASRVPEGEVAVVIGGGSGHYPAFAGLVGPGLAHGAAMGNVFASPSAEQVYTVAKAAHAGGGVLLSYGNYAGDVLNFDQAQARLRAEGIRCETVVVTDDISSAPPSEKHKRRGIAGDLTVFRAVCAAAEAGLDLDAVAAVGHRANARTRTMGVAFSGCILPGAEAPLFTVPEGRMGVGMGIHGEPGIGESDIPTADALAADLVARLLAERPDEVPETAGARVAVVLNGLGSVKYEELFVTYRAVARELEAAGLVIVQPDVGEFCTSFQMAGCSLTLLWLDDELEGYWGAPCDAPAYRKGSVAPREAREASEIAAAAAREIPEAREESRKAAEVVLAAVEALSAQLDADAEELGRLDAIAGDGDHGIGMQRGARAALAAVRPAVADGAGAGTALEVAGEAWAFRAGGTSGALWGLILRAIGAAVGDEATPDAGSVSRGVTAAEAEVMRYGGGERGDKTLLDVLGPVADTLAERAAAGATLTDAWDAAADTAESAAAATADLLPRIGRARPHAEKALGTPDPGAVSMASVVRAVARVLARSASDQLDSDQEASS